jgi:23S rRNA pseudoU1915 N3-methylase RlmH
MILFKRYACPVLGDHNLNNMGYIWLWIATIQLFTFLGTQQQPGQIYGADAFLSIVPDWKYNYRYIYCPLAKTSTIVCMGRKVTIRIVGRKQGGEEWLEEACDMYLQRLKPTGFEVSTEWYKTNDALMKVHHEQSSPQAISKQVPIVLLDPTGIRCTSESFTDKIHQWLEEGGSRLVFVVGGGKQQFCCSSVTWPTYVRTQH